MGVFNKTPYTNFHELNLNWVIKKIKEVAADNTFLKQFFKTIEDEHILGVVTKVTENNNNTVKTDYLNESTQQMDNYTVYNKTGTDGAISGAVTPIANRVTSAEGRLDDAEGNITSILNTLPTLSAINNLSISNKPTGINSITITGLKYGKIVELNLTVNLSVFTNGTQYQFLINNMPAIASGTVVSGRAISGYNAIDMYIANDGVVTLRNLGSSMPSGTYNFSGLKVIYLTT